MNFHKPYFSVIIPVYNKQPHIIRCLTSVFNQTFGGFEVLLINDASTDKSVEEVLKFNDSRMHILHRDTPGPGGYAARNLGIKKAKGKWLAFLDADDEWLPEHLQRMVELSDKYPDCKFLSCGWKYISQENYKYLDHFYERKHNIGSHEISFKEYLKLCIKGMQPTWTGVACLRNNNFAKNLFPAERADRGGDLYAWIKYLTYTKKMAWSSHIGANYYRDSINMVTKTISGGDACLVRLLVSEVVPLLDTEQSNLVLQYCNRLIWRTWKDNLFDKSYKPYNLVGKLSWRGDIIYCLIYFAISLLPGNLLFLAHRISKASYKAL